MRFWAPLAIAVLEACGAASRPPCEHTSGPAHLAPNDEQAIPRSMCAFDATKKATETVAWRPNLARLEHVIVVIQENRSFDHYLSELPGLRDRVQQFGKPQPNGRGAFAPRYHAKSPCFGGETDPAHEWSDAHLAYANGAMDGFVAAGGCGAMAYYTREDLPFYYSLASTFATSERHFASIVGPTWPNHYFFWLGTSCGYAEDITTSRLPVFDCGAKRDSILDRLKAKNVPIGIYEENVESFYVGSGLVAHSGILPQVPLSTFDDAIMKPDFPAFTLVGSHPYVHDEHPPTNIHEGEVFVKHVVDKLLASPHWKTSALFITYDEYGGFYDHVAPPPACDPEPNIPRRDYAFDQLGFRVPLIVVSPFARRGYVSDVDSDHTSITRFIEAWKDLSALTTRDANAWPLFDMFDFENPNYDIPQLADVIIPPGETEACKTPGPAVCPPAQN